MVSYPSSRLKVTVSGKRVFVLKKDSRTPKIVSQARGASIEAAALLNNGINPGKQRW
jgi:hypothetical protein